MNNNNNGNANNGKDHLFFLSVIFLFARRGPISPDFDLRRMAIGFACAPTCKTYGQFY